MKRESNIELCRIVAMLLVLLLHANYFSLGGVEYADIQADGISAFTKAFAEQLCIICVNVFILISGWFGIRPNVKGGLSLLFQVFFYHILVILLFFCIGETLSLKQVLFGFYFGRPYWFIISYLILYALSPILNAFIESSTPRIYASVLTVFFLMEFIYGWIWNLAAFNSGYTTISFIGLYLLAQFVRRYSRILISISAYKCFLLYILFSVLPVGLFFLTGHKFNIIAYSSPFVILSSLFFFLTFNQMKISSKVINFLACSSLSIYLIHLHPLIYMHFKNLMRTTYETLGGCLYVMFVIVFAVCFGMFCVFLDKARILTWNYLCTHIVDNVLLRLNKLIDRLYSCLGF